MSRACPPYPNFILKPTKCRPPYLDVSYLEVRKVAVAGPVIGQLNLPTEACDKSYYGWQTPQIKPQSATRHPRLNPLTGQS